jgi:hypothetical protein
MSCFKDKSKWRVDYVYDEFDAWVDYGEVVLQSVISNDKIRFVWTNWFEGEIQVPEQSVKYYTKLFLSDKEK